MYISTDWLTIWVQWILKWDTKLLLFKDQMVYKIVYELQFKLDCCRV